MFTVRFITEDFAPGQTVLLRWAPNWTIDRGGVYTDGAWTFDLDEAAFPFGIEFKFVVSPGRWMNGNNIVLQPDQLLGVHDYAGLTFPYLDAVVVERGVVPQRFFVRNLDPDAVYDVIIVGSGMGGGVLADELSDAGLNVLVLEAGSYLFPTHVGNLPRRLKIGQFDKHVWSLWQDFQVRNYINAPYSDYQGGQGFNLGGRSIFWGGLIPRQAAWELMQWPTTVRDYLLSNGYPEAEATLNKAAPFQTTYQDASRNLLQAALPGYLAEDASMALQYVGATAWSVPAGLFSTADLLMENRLLPAGYNAPTVNLNFAVWSVTKDPNNARRVTGVVGWDLLAQRERVFKANTVVIAAGTMESAKIALQSQLEDPNGKIGKGITDHTIRFRHFTLPAGVAPGSLTDSAKVLLRHGAATTQNHAFDIVVEFGADFNQGRYVDPHNLALQRAAGNNWMLCELVFMHYAELNDANQLTVTGVPADPITISMNASPPPNAADLAEADQLAADLFATLGAHPVMGEAGLFLQPANLGGVAHEVGTLRMADDGTGVVDQNLRFLAYDNLFACDNSVFPTSPAANPSLTLAALALRLAKDLSQ